jgi:large-conductance mechanosensitive channel
VVRIQSFEDEKATIKVDEMKVAALDEEYKEYNFDKLTILNITHIKLNDKLSFDIFGDITPSNSKKEKKYEILLIDNNNKMLNTICHFPVINRETTQTISCISSDNTQSLQFKIDSGIYNSREDEKDKLILNIRENMEIIAPKKKEKISTWIIVLIAIAAFVIICLIIFLIVKFKNKNNDLSRPSASDKLNTQKQKIKNIDDSKDVIVYKN